MDKQYCATLVSHTHWDRAWYVTFQEFRMRLVRLVDRLLDLLAAQPSFRVYMLDGQMAVLEDYLEVRPQRAGELQALCRGGRIQVGPWYVLPDEFLVSPEALVHNLMLGHRMGRDYGGVIKIGYVPDGFGHIAQLPQILRGFGIDNAFFWRGMGQEGDRLGTEFDWSAPDGSRVTTILMPWGYHNVSNIGYAIHWGDTSQMEFDMPLAIEQIRQALDALKPMAHTPALLLMNGIDHAEPEPRIPEVIAQANRAIQDTEIRQGTLAEHLAEVRSAGAELPEFEGEFRWGRYAEILQGVYSTRIHLKQINHRVESLLERYAEPLAALAWLSGASVPVGTGDLIATAWRWLLKNHPHDDIYGSGIDKVHEEMLYRFDQAEQIGQYVVRDSLRQIARQADFTAQPGVPVLIYNPLGQERHEVAVGNIDFDFDDPAAGSFQLVDPASNVVPHQVLGDEEVFWMETLKPNRKRRLRVAFPVRAPAFGYTTCYAQPLTPPARRAAEAAPASDWQVREDGAENRFLAFSIAADGGLDITDKQSGRTYRGLHHFSDVDDAGDEYSYSPCPNPHQVSTAGGKATTRLLLSGAIMASFQVERVLHVPEALTEDRQHRSPSLVALPITSEIRIYRDQPGIYIETEFDNTARDHKLSVAFPTGLPAEESAVDSSFAVMRRAIDLPASEGWVEDPTPLMHQRAFTDVSSDGCGLAILNRGLPAVEVTHGTDGALVSLTLLRSVGWLSRDDLSTRRVAAGPILPTPGAQCLGRQRYEYAILPHAGDWQEVYPAAYAYVAPLLVARADTHEGLDLREMNITRDDPSRVKEVLWPRGGANGDSLSFLKVEPQQAVLSAVRRAEDEQGLVVRVYNVSRSPVVARLRTGFDLQAAYECNLLEERGTALPVSGARTLELPLRAGQVATCELMPVRGPRT